MKLHAQPSPRSALTPRQAQILAFIADHLFEAGYPPTLREIGDCVGIKSTNGVNDHLKALEKKGFIERAPMRSRGIRILRMEAT